MMLITVLAVCVFFILIGLVIGHFVERREWQARREFLQRRLRKYRKSCTR